MHRCAPVLTGAKHCFFKKLKNMNLKSYKIVILNQILDEFNKK